MKRALALLLAGGELPPELALRAGADPQAALRHAGVLLRAAVSGLRALLIARGMVKREFRIEQTMLHTKDNNPLKFAASDEQALAALLDPRARSLQAMQESIGDLTSHQVAVLAATQTAARALLERLDPSVLEAEDTGGRKFLDSTEKRLWEAYKRRHAKLLEQFEDDFDSAFGTAFARAYERALDKGSG
jgi:type VI secretion system protein ImpI/type VI secretion system protein